MCSCLVFSNLVTKCFKKSSAFSLVEVLITLVIIGVVAAMTLPVMINKYQERVNETRYKKAISILQQAFHLAMVETDTPGNMQNTYIWDCLTSDNPANCYEEATGNLFKNIMWKGSELTDRLKELSYGETQNLWNDTEYSFSTADGFSFGFLNDDNFLKILVDTTSLRRPNLISKDLYLFKVLTNGKLVDITGTELITYNNNDNTNTNTETPSNPSGGGENGGNEGGGSNTEQPSNPSGNNENNGESGGNSGNTGENTGGDSGGSTGGNTGGSSGNQSSYAGMSSCESVKAEGLTNFRSCVKENAETILSGCTYDNFNSNKYGAAFLLCYNTAAKKSDEKKPACEAAGGTWETHSTVGGCAFRI